MDAITALHRMDGAARQSTLLSAGVNRHEIRRALAAGSIERPFRGCLTLPQIPLAQALACYFDARLTCLSAAAAIGIRTLHGAKAPHLEVPASRAAHRRASSPHRFVCMHRSRSFAPGARVVSVERAIDMASQCATPLEQVVMVDHALAQGWMRESDIDSFVVTPLRIRRWLRCAADPGSGSVPETCARVAMRKAGLHVETQPAFGDGRRADFLVEGRLYVEVDGYEFHANRLQFDEDRARDRYLVGKGYRVMRFTYGDAVRAPASLVADVKAALAVAVR